MAEIGVNAKENTLLNCEKTFEKIFYHEGEPYINPDLTHAVRAKNIKY